MRRRLLLLTPCLPFQAQAEPTVLRLCGNVASGRPEDGAAAHLLLQAALKQMPQVRLDYTGLPWQRCLSEAAAGQFDAVLAASHSAERAQHLHYPLDASGAPDARLRMFQLGYALLKRKDSPVSWDGERIRGTSRRAGESLGAERGYSIVQFARSQGGVVEDRFPHQGSLLAALRLKRIAGILIPQENAAQLLADEVWAKELEISGPSLQTKAYYLPVSTPFMQQQPQLVQQLWALLAKERQQPAFQRQFSLALSGGKRRDIQP